MSYTVSMSSPVPPVPRRARPLARAFLIAAGWALVLTAAAGVVLPLLPTTPFLLLAAWCFVRSSERMHRWLLDSPVFGRYLREWQERRTVPREAKVKAILLVTATLGSTIVFFTSDDRLRLLLAFLGIGVIVFLARLPSERRDRAPLSLAPDERREP